MAEMSTSELRALDAWLAEKLFGWERDPDNACYRLGRRPSGKLLDDLTKTRAALEGEK